MVRIEYRVAVLVVCNNQKQINIPGQYTPGYRQRACTMSEYADKYEFLVSNQDVSFISHLPFSRNIKHKSTEAQVYRLPTHTHTYDIPHP
jgi:hypothetical protein